MYFVEDLYRDYGNYLGLELMAQEMDLKRNISLPEVHRPGLTLVGFLKNFATNSLLVFGKEEIFFVEELPNKTCIQRLEAILTEKTPAVIIADHAVIPEQIISICHSTKIPLFRSKMSTTELVSKLTFLLQDEFAPEMSAHGTFIEAFGMGVLIQGDSSIGKSEAALGLIDRGHRLISDDLVKFRLRKDSVVEGRGLELNQHLIEIRGIGIINVGHLYGATCVRGSKSLDLIVKLEEWDDQAFYDRIGLDEQFMEMLHVKIPYYILPVKPGRDVVLLIETIVLNHRLKIMGYHSAREFNKKLLETISRKQSENFKESQSKKSSGIACSPCDNGRSSSSKK